METFLLQDNSSDESADKIDEIKANKKGKYTKMSVSGKSRPSKKPRQVDGDPAWEDIDETFQNPNKDAPFLEYTGINRPSANAESVLDHFLLFFPLHVVDKIVDETNTYYQQLRSEKQLSGEPFETKREKLLAFLGINIAMGLAKLPTIEDYCRKGITHMPWFNSVMPRRKFQQVLRFLHLADNSKQLPRSDPNYNKLYKLGDLMACFNKCFKEMYAPRQNLSIDEQMIGSKSRIGFLQYMPKKPKKFGIKVWVLCEAKSGYCLQFQIYTDKHAGGTEHGLSHRVVHDLMEKYLDKGYHLFFNNFYTSLKLVKDLEKRKTYACWTVRVNRGEFPSYFKKGSLDIGQSHYMHNGNIVACHWKDKRDAFLLSSIHENKEKVISRHSGETTKPEVIIDYNSYMNGVDKCDQHLSYYTIGRKSIKWWKKVFFRMFELCIINAMCIYFAKNADFAGRRGSHKLFREVLVHQLFQPYLDKIANEEMTSKRMIQVAVKQQRVDDDVRLIEKHYVTKKETRRKCSNCAYKINQETGKRKNTRTHDFCEKCKKYICCKCFKYFHTASNLA